MVGRPEDPPETPDDERRQLAEDVAAAEDVLVQPPSAETTTRLLHELRVHQIELEMQNEELRRAQADLETTRQEYVELFDLAPVGYLTLSAQKTVGSANMTAAHLLGVERADLVGVPFTRYIEPVDQDVFHLHQRRLLESWAPQTCELRLRRRGGDAAAAPSFWARLESRSHRLADGSFSHWVAFSDVTERHRAETELKRLHADLEHQVDERTHDLAISNAELEEFVYSITHDLRSPLRALAGFSELIGLDYSSVLDADGQDYLNRIHAAALHMGDVMDALLALSRVNRADLLIRDVDLSAVAREIAAELAGDDPERSVKFEIADGLECSADASLCEILLRNLLGNAWKFTAGTSQAHIRFGTVVTDGRVAFCVRDNGAGFDQRYAGQLFRPFERLHAVEEYPGTGIGLATVRRIVGRFGGACWAEGEVGKGAALYFTLPDRAGVS